MKKHGYADIQLTKNKKITWFRLHRLVAEAFIPNPDSLPLVNHKDENPLNNKVSNLEWCTYKHNNNYGTRNKRISEKHINNKISCRPVICVETNVKYESITNAGKLVRNR